MLGKIVLYGLMPEQTETQNYNKVLPAIVVGDNGGNNFNLRVFGDVGDSFSVTSVPKDEDPQDGKPDEYKWIPLPE